MRLIPSALILYQCFDGLLIRVLGFMNGIRLKQKLRVKSTRFRHEHVDVFAWNMIRHAQPGSSPFP
jgi:hypothetical protein